MLSKRTTKGRGLQHSKIAAAPPVEADEFYSAVYDPDVSWNQNNYNARTILAKTKRAKVKVAPEAVAQRVVRQGTGMKASTLKSFLSGSYSKKKDQQHNIEGYIRDDSLSGQRATVYHNPNTGHAVVTHKGTQSIQDWGTNAMTAIGMASKTKRMKHAQKIQNEAAAKYGNENILTTGHSLGAKIAEKVGQKSAEVITYNKPTTLENIGKRISHKQTDIRTHNDPVSFLSGTQKRQDHIKTINTDTWSPLKAHATDQLEKLGDQHMGKSIKKKQSPWIQHVKRHAAKHSVSYRQALLDASATYRG
jgi:hypothetical protein